MDARLAAACQVARLVPAQVPFGELAWDHACRSLGREATEKQIANAVTALLRRADTCGPENHEKPQMSKRDRRVAARTKAAAAGRRQAGISLVPGPSPFPACSQRVRAW